MEEKTIILASNNKNKLREIKNILSKYNIKVISQAEAGYDIDVEETGKTFEENAVLKAKAIYDKLKKPVISDDSGLEIDALNGEPGVYSKRYAGENATNEDKINKVLRKMQDVANKNRTARFTCAICFIDQNGKKHIFKESCEGTIINSPRGENGFGYDPIFLYGEKTFAEMTEEEKDKVSHRGKAMEDVVNYFEKNGMEG